MTNSDVTKELPEGSRCMWQITPREMPSDMAPQSLELWQTPEGLVLLQMHVEDRKADWYLRVRGVTRFNAAP